MSKDHILDLGYFAMEEDCYNDYWRDWSLEVVEIGKPERGMLHFQSC